MSDERDLSTSTASMSPELVGSDDGTPHRLVSEHPTGSWICCDVPAPAVP